MAKWAAANEPKKRLVWVAALAALAALALAGCGGGGDDGAAKVVEEYYAALSADNLDEMKSLSCAAWEADAQLEYEAFSGVQTELADMECQSGEQQGDFTIVTCSGAILATYGTEVQEFDLSSFVFKTAQEAGEWRMCGY